MQKSLIYSFIPKIISFYSIDLKHTLKNKEKISADKISPLTFAEILSRRNFWHLMY